ncbi:Gfo/Idh/MocA family protein [Chthonobacter rhizosphaerae]|uniref:Gfo/Idh/MocA family protein n=1 Tax=Chthonobacter rhizosphaerae TaxID=2735553 RepID=UPI0015EF0F6B|nr:Gfo/Idh/MocA family oxidoreductase [Chthonobacter rhizosphaerae]
MSKHKLAIVGVGKIAIDQHIPSIEETGLFRLAALVSQRGVEHDGLPSFRTQADMLSAMPDVTAVAICTPPDVRHGLVREALRAGRHVLMEKPPTASLMELEDLRAEAERAGRTLFATWHSQFNAAVDAARERLAGARIRSVRVDWKEDVRKWHPGQEWIWQAGGFGVFDPGINAVSILTRVLPFPPFVASADLTFPANRDTPIAASVVFRRPPDVPGARFTADLDWRQTGGEIWTITIEVDGGPTLTLSRGGTCLAVDGTTVVDEADREYRRIYRRFHALVEAGESDVDAAPLRVVADAFLVGRRLVTDAFDW